MQAQDATEQFTGEVLKSGALGRLVRFVRAHRPLARRALRRGDHLVRRPCGPCSANRRHRMLAAALALPALLVACTSEGTDGTDSAASGPLTTTENSAGLDRTWPGDEWEVVSPEEAGLDPHPLEYMAAVAEAGGSECLVVTKDGRIVGEWYWAGFDRETEREVYSVTKSITSTLVGLAQDRGLLDLDQPASDFIPEWQGTPSGAVTIRNLLSMDSGRRWSYEIDFTTLPREPDQTAYAVGLEQQHAPGAVWTYNSAAVQTLDRVIAEATGMPTHAFAQQALFEPLGMDSEISQDATGNTTTYIGVQASCRDLARFGHLFAAQGEWAGEQLLSPAFVQEATSASQELNPRYGLLWWLNDTEFQRLARSGPDDMFAATGLGSQYIDVFPSSGIVVTRLGMEVGGMGLGESGVKFTHEDVAEGVRDALVAQ